YGAEVVRMNPVERKADDPGALFRPEQVDVVHPAQGIAELRYQLRLVPVDGVEPDVRHVIASDGESDRLDDRRSAGLETLRRRGVSGPVERDPLDHRAATLPRWHRFEQRVARPEGTDPGRAVELVAGESVEI